MLRRGLFVILVVLFSCAVLGLEEGEYVPGELIVKLEKDVSNKITGSAVSTGINSFDELNEKYAISKIENVYELEPLNFGRRLGKIIGIKPGDDALRRTYKLEFSKDIDINEIIEEYSKLSKVEYAQPNYLYHIDVVPNDLRYNEQWAHKKTQIEEAWEITVGDSNEIVAVIDVGVDYTHPDLVGNIWVNKNEDINKNGKFDNFPFEDGGDLDGLDNDINGYVDDIVGYDFVDTNTESYETHSSFGLITDEDYIDADNDPKDVHGHGTHVAGIVAAVADNKEGIAGVCWNCRIMPLRAGYGIKIKEIETGLINGVSAAQAIIYAVNNGARIISMSFGLGRRDSPLQANAINYAYHRGVVLVASAGNEGKDTTQFPQYPAGYGEVISVSASDSYDNKASISNYGYWIDVAAPGEDILSTVLDSEYEKKSGTSMSTPYISGLVGLLRTKHPNLGPEGIKWIIRNSVNNIDSDKYIGTGRINAFKALQIEEVPTIKPIFYMGKEWKIEDIETFDIIARAFGGDFGYKFEYGKGIYPDYWIEIDSGEGRHNADIIATWNVKDLDSGTYIVRLSSQKDDESVVDNDFIRVNVIRDLEPLQINPENLPPNGILVRELELGSPLMENLIDPNGILTIGTDLDDPDYANLLKVETSLTSRFMEYQTDIVMEVAKRSIKYHLHKLSSSIIGSTFNLAGENVKVIGSGDFRGSMVIEVGGVVSTVKDGDAFIGEDPDDPNWSWDIDSLDTNNPVIGIENNFLFNDPTDNPPKVGECIMLPNNYIKICLDLNTFEYSDCSIEYIPNVDLSEADFDLKNVPAIFIHTSSNRGIILEPELYTNEIWVIGDRRVFYRDNDTHKIKYFKRIKIYDEELGIINSDNNLVLSASPEQDYGVNIKVNTLDLKELLNARFRVLSWNRKINSLGDVSLFSENDELTLHRYGKKTKKIGDFDKDLRTTYGIIVENPNKYGLSDKVVLKIPNKQIKALITIKYDVVPTKKCLDFNRDGEVNFPDFLMFAKAYNDFISGIYDSKFDLDDDGDIDVPDFLIFADNFGKGDCD